MKKTIFLAILMMSWLAVCSNLMADDTAAKKLFKEAFFQQTVEGKTVEAIRLYEQGLKEPDVSARMASTAWFQLGICYEKQDNKAKASECYQKVIAQYPDETKNVAKAKKKLATIKAKKKKRMAMVAMPRAPITDICIAHVENLPVDQLDIKDKKVTREYIKRKFGPPQFEHPKGLFLNYGAKYGLRFDMDGDRVRQICLFQTFPGEIYVINPQGKKILLPPLRADIFAANIKLEKAEKKKYLASLKNLPVDRLDITDKKVTRQYIKQKFGKPQYEPPNGGFLNYGAKYGLRFDMDGDRVREICLFQSFLGKVFVMDTKNQVKPFSLQKDLVSRNMVLVSGENLPKDIFPDTSSKEGDPKGGNY